MEFFHLFTLLVFLLLLLIAGVMLSRRNQRRRALAAPFPAGWLATIRQNIPPYSKLPPEVQQQVQDYTQEFLFDKRFEGCGGLVLTDEIKVTIAAQASLLLLNRKVRCYPRLYSVLVYPSAYGPMKTRCALASRGGPGRWCWRGTACSAGRQISPTATTW